MKGDIALPTIGYFVIALVTIVLVLTLVGTKISPSVKNAYCSFIRGLREFLPLPSHMKLPLPSYCEVEGTVYIETKTIESRNPDNIEFLIASYVLACWEKTGKLDVGQNTLCYELILNGANQPGVTQNGVDQKLSNEGYSSIMTWKIESPLTESKSIGISYNSTSKRIEVS
jgi:hypothetical protein